MPGAPFDSSKKKDYNRSMFRKKYKQTLFDSKTPVNILNWEGGQPGQIFDELIQPMVYNTPDWYKQTQRWVEAPDKTGGKKQKWPGVKHCLPFLDALVTGYGIFLAESIWVELDENNKVIISHNNTKREPVGNRPPQVTDPLPNPPGCLPEHYIWALPVAIELPPGFSGVFTHPFNRWDLPFISTTAIIDDYNCPGANMAFHLREGFLGEIPAGTMIAQILPFRREEWIAKELKGRLWKMGHMNRDGTEYVSEDELLDGWYRKNHWKKKVFK